ncbi:molybdopterin-dependent oxidoreductase [Altererythrobacter salegens]|uniref:Molybdopterin-dependent oxidoreductase n=1 Tax=Croceibacterium salegens TaxID=1737568 RepID=A0A6I4T141_9SPHN|nr:nitrate reductase [Croceibacterium salegens]MXO61006.1 molybdopterin-dependent oxidoreductase [Croceibacterium salegens]
MKSIRTTCAYCGVGCGIAATVTGERAVSIAGDPDHPANEGQLCSKGTYLGETVGLEGRLLDPMIGERETEWNEALDLVAKRLKDTVEQHGPDSVAFYLSGQLLTEDYYVANKLAKGFIGTANVDTNSRLCMASAVAAHVRAFGEDVVPCTYDDLDSADLIILVGSNTAWCHPIVWRRIERARERRGAKLVVIDPRRTETAELADLHVQIAPDGDVPLFNALLRTMKHSGYVDEKYLRARCSVPEGFWDQLEDQPGIPQETFREFAAMVATNPRMVTLFSQGANQSAGGTDKGNAIINLHLSLGRINREGMGPFSITGQPNAMGGREVGGLSNMLACHLGFSEAERTDVARFWQAPALCSGPGLKAVDLFRAIDEGRIKFVWIMATNPAVSMPDAAFVREALRKCPTVVVSDVIADTDTALLADIRLPALGWGEKDGTVTNSERCISRQRALFPPPGSVRADWQIVCDVAARLGFGSAFAFQSTAEVFREYAAMTALAGEHGKLLDLTDWADCSEFEYAAMRPFRWGGAHPLKRRYPTPYGKARLVSVSSTPPAPAQPALPLRLNTGRYRDHWHTMTRTALSAKLSMHRREALVEVHPEDGATYGLEQSGLARVATARGEAIYRVSLTEAQRQGEIFVPMHWSDLTASSARTGLLVEPIVDPHSGQPAFKNVAASIAPVHPDWRAFLVTRDPVRPEADYWSRAKINGGWLHEIAGSGELDADALLPAGPRREASDPKRGMLRLVVTDRDGGLAAALYVTRNGQLPDRDWIVRQFAAPDAGTTELLAGRPAAAPAERGNLVCVCFDVGECDIMKALEEGAETVKDVSSATRAGTNCGSCRTIIAGMLKRKKQSSLEPVS